MKSLKSSEDLPDLPVLVLRPAVNVCEQASVGAGAITVESVLAFFVGIAREEGWQPGGDLQAHRDRSTYFVLTDGKDSKNGVMVLAGALQIVHPDDAGGLPNLAVWPELELDVRGGGAGTAHIVILAMAKEWRGRRGGAPFWRLTASMWHYCVSHNIRELWLETTPKTLRAYRLLGWPVQVRGELREHWGEPVYPCSLSVREVAGALAERAVRSRAYRRVLADMVGALPARIIED